MNLKKPKFWDFKKPNIYAYILLPIALILQSLKLFKNKSKTKLKIKTICVGHIYLGGTGKTSLSIKINKLLAQGRWEKKELIDIFKNILPDFSHIEKGKNLDEKM